MAMNLEARRWAVWAVVCAAATVACVRWVDRPVVDYFDTRAWHAHAAARMSSALMATLTVAVAALFFLFCCGWKKIAGQRLTAWARLPLMMSWSVMWALGAEAILKGIFGRGWPDPTYLREHAYGFRLLHASWHWNSFPSGVALVAGALAAVVWMERPSVRWAASAAVCLILMMVIVSNNHWVSDVIAGAYVGAAIGRMTSLLLREEQAAV